MARPLRIEIDDGHYHVTSRGLERRRIVLDDADRRIWLALLDKVAVRRAWRVFAWALMDNHFHLFLRTPHADLSAGIHDLNSGYVSCFNRRHNRRGPLFQGRFKGILVECQYHAWELTRYIHLNPPRAGLCDRPDIYPWSSCAMYLRNGAPGWLAWEEVLRDHGATVRAARRQYARFLMDGLSRPAESPVAGVKAGVLLGSDDFIGKMKAWLKDRLPDRDVPAARELRSAPSMQRITQAVSEAFSVAEPSLLKRRSRGNEARAAAIYLCRRMTRHPLDELGEYFGGITGQSVSWVVANVSMRQARDKSLRSRIANIEKAVLRGT
jgi:REP element-mobilizing transposase RayT